MTGAGSGAGSDAGSSAGTGAAGPCPPADRLLAFTAGQLSDAAAAEIEAHIDGCATCRQTLSSLARGAAPTEAFGRYRLESILGSGGMGIVYRAWDPQLSRPLAIKVVRHAEGDAAGRARLVREAKSLARLSHPNVCHVYDVGSEADEVWVAMELIDGVGLRQWAAAHPSPRLLLPILLAAAEGLAAAHAADIIHRDVKPENVLVTRDDRAVVTDFGLARIVAPLDAAASTLTLEPTLTASGVIAGTPAYLAPEQLSGGPLDARVDQFAWALMTWELLTGVRPFPIAAGARLDAVRAGVAPPPGLSRHVAAVLSRALSAAPGDRFPSMRQLIDALRPIKGKTTSKRRRTGTSQRRERRPLRPWIVAAAAAALAVCSTLLVWPLIRKPTRGPQALAPPAAAAPDAATADAPASLVEPIVPDGGATDGGAPGGGATGAAAPGAAATEVRALAPDRRRPEAAAPPKPSTPGATPSAPGSPAAGSQAPAAITATETAPGPALARTPSGRKYLSDNAHASLEMFCGLPMDPAKPGPDVRRPVMDWGKVTRRELVPAKVAGRELELLMYEVAGARATYRFNGATWSNTMGVLDVAPGSWIALCERDHSDLYELPPAWGSPISVLEAALPLTGPPRVGEIAQLAPIHISAHALQTGAAKGELRPDRRYLVRAKVDAADGPRWKVGGFWLAVPGGVKGASLVAAGARLWFVVERPTVEDSRDGTPARVVVRAAAVVDNLLPH